MDCQNKPRCDRRGQRRQSELAHEEWLVVGPSSTVGRNCRRTRNYVVRTALNGIRPPQRHGIPKDGRPKALRPRNVCCDHWRMLADGRHMERIDARRRLIADGEMAGREAGLALAIVDAQSIECGVGRSERGNGIAPTTLCCKRNGADGRLLTVTVAWPTSGTAEWHW